MTTFSWCGYTVEVDGPATRAWYAQAEEWSCTCGHCRNFLALARARKLPGELLDILDGLGIPPEKATDLCEFCDEDGRLLYGLAYRVAGRVLEKPPEGAPQSQSGLSCQDDPRLFYPWGVVGFPEPCFDLSWTPWLPWVLDEPIDGPEEERK